MDKAARAQLQQLSSEFYQHHAASFDDTRQAPWPSWQRLLSRAIDAKAPKSILDLGCGNGRFAAFLDDSGIDGEYTGVDAELQLIERAKDRYPAKRFVHASIDDYLAAGAKQFDLVVAFGLFHHLPGAEYRAEVLGQIADHLSPEGVACVSLWQPTKLRNFEAKAFTGPSPVTLEPGDHLLGWQGDFGALRYCHDFSDNEIETLLSDLALRFSLVIRFQGSGSDATNHYVVLQGIT